MVNAQGYGFTSSSFLHSVQEVYPLCKMALGFLSSKKGSDARSNSSRSSDNKDNLAMTDPERGRAEKPRGGDVDDSDESFTIGRQMEMEADNAIKYRTCSWPKVCLYSPNTKQT